jgi:hypothetical protein
MSLLRLGDRGSAVVELQRLLNRRGFALVIDGDFGPKTELAVRDFQRQAGLVVDGIAGPKTLAMLRGGKLLGEDDILRAARALGVEPAAIKAVNEVESRGRGFLPDGRPVILFERHVMRRRLLDYGFQADKLEAEYPHIVNKAAGGYLGGAREWDRFNEAAEIHRHSAIEASSWGLFQIMGMHWRHLQYPSAEAFFDAMHESEGAQLDAFVRFIQNDPALHRALQDQDWKRFARIFNGPAFAKNRYDSRLESAYERHRTTQESIA